MRNTEAKATILEAIKRSVQEILSPWRASDWCASLVSPVLKQESISNVEELTETDYSHGQTVRGQNIP